ncbi:recombinase RecA [Ursidibacter maritimus]|uniref:Recombinase RecA n=2 Tax=Ursidibacter maritimus TaxID=1331689 RepID=A0A949T5K3_9PAST|nr:DUF5339 family protein [Ursidibacter maritimus]KAE9539163.1 hypothetical protein A1D26_03810 [Ursidibacter maritimus]MBV6526140.1 recombinase RecA [Ursidibacter maritimus]MBV6526982.1 recombinase RecA [Ursidibacter maritimus]MBV6530046.1 recombinase RecA [Ursidibacter maritimus]MBV6531176.1 recombinase RecA [Ursidibacter maritimus]
MKKFLTVFALTAGFSANVMAADFPKVCEEYFELAAEWLEKSGQQGEVQKAALDVIKQQFAEVPKDAQEEACKQALVEIKKALGK